MTGRSARGGRGNGALGNHLEAVKYLNDKLGWQPKAEVVATADWFEGRARKAGNRHPTPALLAARQAVAHASQGRLRLPVHSLTNQRRL